MRRPRGGNRDVLSLNFTNTYIHISPPAGKKKAKSHATEVEAEKVSVEERIVF